MDKVCDICGRKDKNVKTNRILKINLCLRHRTQFRIYGQILDSNSRTRFDPNEIVIYDDYAEIILYDINCEEIARTKIDIEDVDKISKYKWKYHYWGYAQNTVGTMMIHRFLLDCPKGMFVDHINLDKLDNRKSNLRICTHQQNNFNKKLLPNNTSGITGVTWDRYNEKWVSQIMFNNKNIRLGSFNNKADAIKIRKEAEEKYFGEFAYKN